MEWRHFINLFMERLLFCANGNYFLALLLMSSVVIDVFSLWTLAWKKIASLGPHFVWFRRPFHLFGLTARAQSISRSNLKGHAVIDVYIKHCADKAFQLGN